MSRISIWMEHHILPQARKSLLFGAEIDIPWHRHDVFEIILFEGKKVIKISTSAFCGNLVEMIVARKVIWF